MKKFITKSLIILIIISLLPIHVFSSATGKLNVFTDLADAEIYVDGQFAGKEAVVGYVLSVGTHLVKVIYQGKTVFSKTVEIREDRTNTITSEHFVDIRTSTPSRGAVEVEAERLREYRGDASFGYFGSSPSIGLSVKWWFSKNYGLQTIGFTQDDSKIANSSIGLRYLIGFPKKIFSEEVLDAYMAIGYGRSWHTDRISPANDYREEVYNLSFGVEAKLGRLANALFFSQRFVEVDTEDMDDDEDTDDDEDMGGAEDMMVFFGQIITLGLLNICYTSFEIGIDQRTVYSGGSSEILSNMKVNFGLHYYF